MSTVVVCGHVTLDRAGDALAPGGSAWYASRALVALRATARVLTAAGPDFPREALEGMEARVLPSARTTTFENAYAPDGRRTQRVLAAASPLDPAALPGSWRGADAVLLAPVLGELEPARFAAATAGRRVALCVQGLVREVAPSGAVLPRRWAPGPADLAGIDAAVLGDDDVAGQDDLPRRLAATIPIVVFTHGARGCEVIAGGRTTRVGVHPAAEVDPTGAGDVFAAGFLLALARGEDPIQAARLGAAAASIVVEGVGGTTLERVGEAYGRAAGIRVG